MIEVKNLTKKFGENIALKDISFKAEKGIILGLLGVNGAGKSTTMNIISGYISSDSGTVLIGDVDIKKEPIKAKERIGYLPEQPPLYLDMTVLEYLKFVYELKKCRFPKKSHLEEIIELTGLLEVSKRIIKNLSKGYRQRVGLAASLIGNPEVIILDEPTVGLDPKQIIEIRSLIKKLGEYHTVLLSSHILSEVQAICDKIIVIDNGRIIADDTTSNLVKGAFSSQKIIIQIEGEKEEVKKVLESIYEVTNVTVNREISLNTNEYFVDILQNTDPRKEIFRKLASRNYTILEMRSIDYSLEEVFLRLTRGVSEEEEK